MSLLGFLLVLAAAVCHATWNFFVKRINAGPELVWTFSLITVVIYAPLALYFFFQMPAFTITNAGFIIGSCVLHLGYFLLLQRGYRTGDLSVVYPTARATGPMLSTIFAIVILGEQASLQSAAGALVIIFGVLNLSGGLRVRSLEQASSLLFGVAAGTLIGSYTVWDAYAVSVLALPPLLLDYCSSLGRAFLLAPVAARRTGSIASIWREHKLGLFVIAIFNPLAYILALIAMTFTPVIYIAPIREISVVLTVLLGSLLLGEGKLKARLLWSCVILAGVSLLASA
nr:DMT family transporter [uncultured Cohaesibacter sp.]